MASWLIVCVRILPIFSLLDNGKFNVVLGYMNCYSGAAISYNGQGGSSYSIGVSKEKGGARFAANEWNKPQNFM